MGRFQDELDRGMERAGSISAYMVWEHIKPGAEVEFGRGYDGGPMLICVTTAAGLQRNCTVANLYRHWLRFGKPGFARERRGQ